MTHQQPDYPLDYAKTASQSTTDRARDMADTAAEKLKDAGASAHQMAQNLASQAREYGEYVQDAASKVRPMVEKSLEERPMTTLLGAAALGFVLGALWKK